MTKGSINKKELAKSLYINGTFTQEEIAVKVGTTRQTVARWMKEGGWEDIKASLTITPEKIIAFIHQQIMELNDRISQREPGRRFATPQEADALAKLAGAVKKLEDDIGVAGCVSVGMRFLTWLRQVDTQAARTFSDYFDSFIKDQTAR